LKKRTVLVVLLLVMAGSIALKLTSSPAAEPRSFRHLAAGDVIGFEDDSNTYAWLGIPFAKAPVGDLRWRSPRPAEPWQGVKEALLYSSNCAQLLPFSLFGNDLMLGDEDCLYLNVWSPRETDAEAATAKRPVMVWIHGGANTLGGAPHAEAHRLVTHGDVVMVSLQYRLGLFGWFSHPALRATAEIPLDATSNFALLDMIAALHWVQNNIEHFGGNPENVKIFGQSAGAFDVIALLAAPQAKGLFHKAISQSGSLHTIAKDRAENYIDDDSPGLPYSAREFVNTFLINEGKANNREQAKQLQNSMSSSELVSALRAKSVDELFKSAARRGTGTLGYHVATNIQDGLVLPDMHLRELFADPSQYNSVPLILGSNRDEYKLFMSGSESFAKQRFGVLPIVKDPAEYDRIAAYFSQQWQAVGVDEPARILDASQAGNVFTYRFDWSNQPTKFGVDMAQTFGAAHGIEVVFLFGPEQVSRLPLYAMTDDEKSTRALREAMRSYWTHFAHTGKPGKGDGESLPEWQAWQSDADKKLLLDSSQGDGIRMSDATVFIDDLKQRLRDDTAIRSTRERCELYAQLFYYALSSDFWSDEEFNDLGCGEFTPEDFEGLF